MPLLMVIPAIRYLQLYCGRQSCSVHRQQGVGHRVNAVLAGDMHAPQTAKQTLNRILDVTACRRQRYLDRTALEQSTGTVGRQAPCPTAVSGGCVRELVVAEGVGAREDKAAATHACQPVAAAHSAGAHLHHLHQPTPTPSTMQPSRLPPKRCLLCSFLRSACAVALPLF